MKKPYIICLATLAIAGSLIFTACQKSLSSTDNSTPTTQDALVLQSSAAADDVTDNAFNDVFNNVMGVNADAGLGSGIGVFLVAPRKTGTGTTENQFTAGTDSVSHCYTVTIDPAEPGVFPKTITIDFGTGCTGRDGHTRSGKITAIYTGRMKVAGSTATASFDGFYIDSVHVEGTLTIQNKSTSDSRIFTLGVTNGKLSLPTGDYIEINRNHTWTQTGGSSTPDNPADDVYSITGSSSGTAQISIITAQWTTEITEPVIRKLSCPWRVQGQVTVTYNDKTGVLDYGNGDCDNKATMTVGAKVYDITLH